MRKLLLQLILALLAIPVANATDSVVTLTTSLEVGSSVELYAWTTTADEAFTIDWGDGTEKIYNKAKPSYTYGQELKGTVGESQTITIKGDIIYLQMRGQQITSANFENAAALTEVDLENNLLKTFKMNGLPAVTSLDLTSNSITTFDATGNSVLSTLNISKNKLDSHQFNISSLASSLANLNVSENGENFVTLNLIQFEKLEYFTAHSNPELTTVVFYDGNTHLRNITMNDCYIMHFYAISLPNLGTINLSNNALLELEDGSYPNLTQLSIGGNYLSSLDVTKYPKLFSLYCNDNQLTEINVANNPELNALDVSNNQISTIDVSTNTDLSTLSVKGNSSLRKLDISKNTKIYNLNISDTQISYIDLDNCYSLRKFEAANTQCQFFYFNYVNPWGRFNYVDISNNARMTGNSMNFTLRTLPAAYSDYNTLKIDGSNAETADTSYPSSTDMKWKPNVTGDGTATNPDVNTTVKATNTGEKITVTGEYGGITSDQTFEFTKYTTDGGSFYLAQWSGDYFQQLADVTTTAKAGAAIHVVATPDAGRTFDCVMINGERCDNEWFVVNEDATIEVKFRSETSSISFTAPIAQSLSFALGAYKTTSEDPVVTIDWGNGSKQEYTVSQEKSTRIDGVAATPTDDTATMSTITITGDVFYLNLESWGEYGEEMGLWNNKIASLDLSKTNLLTYINAYMNPIRSIDVSDQPDLVELDCSYCELKELDVTHNPALTTFLCYGNELKTLDVSKNPELQELNAKVNQLETIDLSNNSKLLSLNVANNYLETLDVTNLKSLYYLFAMSNDLTSVDVTKNPMLSQISVGHNLLTSLDLSKNPLLQSVSFNDNAIKSLDLSKLSDLRLIDCGGNGMTACELNDFYFTLPQYPTLTDEEKITGSTLTLLTGTETTPNDAENSDTSIATEKGWVASVDGNASGCDVALLTIQPTVNGTLVLTDAEGKEIKSGDKVKRLSPITITTTPDAGYELDKVTANGKTVEGNELKISRNTTVAAIFKVMDSVTNVALDGVTIAGGNAAITVSVESNSRVDIYDVNGRSIFNGEISEATTIPMTTGYYAVRVENAQGSTARIVCVK